MSIDHLWQTWDVDLPNHLKIDVDGLEEKIMAEASQTIADPRLKSVPVEISGPEGSKNPIVHQLTQAGFVQVADFPAHSSDLLKGSRYEDSENYVFVRGVEKMSSTGEV